MQIVKVMARFINMNASEVSAMDMGEIVAFNCPAEDYNDAMIQAMGAKSLYETQGNRMIDTVAQTIGATSVKYFIRG